MYININKMIKSSRLYKNSFLGIFWCLLFLISKEDTKDTIGIARYIKQRYIPNNMPVDKANFL